MLLILDGHSFHFFLPCCHVACAYFPSLFSSAACLIFEAASWDVGRLHSSYREGSSAVDHVFGHQVTSHMLLVEVPAITWYIDYRQFYTVDT